MQSELISPHLKNSSLIYRVRVIFKNSNSQADPTLRNERLAMAKCRSKTTAINYINNSPDELDSIYFHFWGNAFKNTNTSFAEQQLRMSNTKFYFSSTNDKGYYSDLDFTVDGQKAELIFDKKNPDIVRNCNFANVRTISIKYPEMLCNRNIM